MKRSQWIVVLLALLIFPLALGSGAPAQAKDLRVLMLLWRGETASEKGFKEALDTMGYSVKYTTFDAQQDKSKLAEILRKDVEPNLGDFDYIYAFGTTVCKMAKNVVNDKVPIIFTAVTAPVIGELVKDMDVPGDNVSGATNKIPISMQIENARKLVPFSKLAILFNPREKNAVALSDEVKQAASKYGFEAVELNCAPEGNQLEQTLQKLLDKQIKVDVVFLPTDSYLISSAKTVMEKLNEAKIPTIATQEEYLKNGALLGAVADYQELGKLAAEIIDQNQKGKAVSTIPVQKPKTIKLVVNKKTISLLGMDIPAEALAGAQIIE